jgi:hypothetical protein
VPSPAPTGSTVLGPVSCSSASACTAIGAYGASPEASGNPFVERWNGVRWTLQRLPKSIGGLAGVSCAANRRCVAVGTNTASLPVRAVAVVWNGRTWSLLRTPKPRRREFSAVSCAAVNSCMAIGYLEADPEVSFAERWDGSSWALERVPVPRNSFAGFNGVSCPSRNACVAVGEPGVATFVERWNGRRWSFEPTPSVASPANFDAIGVSCWAVRGCLTVPAPLRLSRTGWSIFPDSAPGHLVGVSCASGSACTAVGSFTNSAGQQETLAERWQS